MQGLIGIVIIRSLIRFLGLHTRYLFYKLTNNPKSLKSLSNEYKDDYKDLGKALGQDFLNAVVGILIIVGCVLVAAVVYN